MPLPQYFVRGREKLEKLTWAFDYLSLQIIYLYPLRFHWSELVLFTHPMQEGQEMQESKWNVCPVSVTALRTQSTHPALIPSNFRSFISKVAFRLRLTIILILETALRFVIKEEYCKVFGTLC